MGQGTVPCGVPLFFAGGVDGAFLAPRFLYPFPTLGTTTVVAFSWHLSRDTDQLSFLSRGHCPKITFDLVQAAWC